MKNLILIISTFFIFTFSSCKKNNENPKFITFKNNSSIPVYTYFSFNFPDTMLLLNDKEKGLGGLIKPGKELKEPTADKYRRWNDYISASNTQSMLMVFFLSEDVVNQYSLEQIQKDYKILKRYDLTVDQLKSMKWEVTYP